MDFRNTFTYWKNTDGSYSILISGLTYTITLQSQAADGSYFFYHGMVANVPEVLMVCRKVRLNDNGKAVFLK